MTDVKASPLDSRIGEPETHKATIEHAEHVVPQYTQLPDHSAAEKSNPVADEDPRSAETKNEKDSKSNAATGGPEFQIPKTCKAGCVVNPGPNFTVQVEEVPVPEPGPDEVLLKLNATGICYSDLHYMLEDLAMPKMTEFGVRSAGHEGAGVVVKVGSGVKNWKVGDRGGVKPMWDCCMNCELCWDGFHETYCSKTVATGLMTTGTYQQYITSPARYTTRIPDGVDDFTAGPIMCSGSTIYRSIVESQLKAGDWAVFPGAGGGVGHMGVQIAKAMGFRVIGIDGGEEKKALCMKLGCESFVDFTKTEDVVAEVIKITGGLGAHGVFVTATSAAAYKTAPMMVRVGGRVMCIGLTPAGTATVGADPGWFIFKNLHVIGTMVGSMRDTDAALDFAARGLLKPIYELYPIARLPEAVDKLRNGKVAGRGVVDFNS
ncbi:GroES-like protein [Coleophoma cylindrospora]|uniref:GroES-like protein n=1 Tax=Coleophoma cylindrospora TaxID=1849047 RepID=A0A3D8R0S0_9HELO|nr:GroES-like protein [Coleophoma cylindrospora]